MRAKRIDKHEDARSCNGKFYQSPVPTSRNQENFERIKAGGIHDGGYSRQNNHQVNGVRMKLDARKGENGSMVFKLKAKRYAQEEKEEKTNLPEEKKYGNDGK